MNRLSESKIERDVTKYATDRGVMQLKIEAGAQAGWPDRMYLFPGGRILFIEFKKPGGVTSAIQAFIHKHLRKQGFRVETVDCTAVGNRIIQQVLDAA